MTLTDDQLCRQALHIVLKEIGGAGQGRLLESHVAIIGAGGIGNPAFQYLAAAGVGKLTVIDDDAVDLSNLQRKVLFATADVGRPKADAAREAVARPNPAATVAPVHQRTPAHNAEAIPSGQGIMSARLSYSPNLFPVGTPDPRLKH